MPATHDGLPVSISTADNIISVDFSLLFDPLQMTILAIESGADLPNDWTVISNLDVMAQAGVFNVTAFGFTPVAGENLQLVNLTAVVPDDANYTTTQVLSVETLF